MLVIIDISYFASTVAPVSEHVLQSVLKMVVIFQDGWIRWLCAAYCTNRQGSLYQIWAHATLFCLRPLLENPIPAWVDLGKNHQQVSWYHNAIHSVRFLLVLTVYGHTWMWFLFTCSAYFHKSIMRLKWPY